MKTISEEGQLYLKQQTLGDKMSPIEEKLMYKYIIITYAVSHQGAVKIFLKNILMWENNALLSGNSKIQNIVFCDVMSLCHGVNMCSLCVHFVNKGRVKQLKH